MRCGARGSSIRPKASDKVATRDSKFRLLSGRMAIDYPSARTFSTSSSLFLLLQANRELLGWGRRIGLEGSGQQAGVERREEGIARGGEKSNPAVLIPRS